MGYEETFHRFLQGIMADVERRIRRGHERLALNAKKEQVYFEKNETIFLQGH